MASNKLYTARQAAEAVLAKTHELLAKHEKLEKGDWKKIHDKLEREGYSKESADKIDGSIKAKLGKSEALDQKKPREEAPSDKVGKVPNPEKNPNEQKEGNNELAGTTPTQVGQDGKNVPGGDEIRGYLKLAKFIGHKEAKRKMGASQPAPTQHPAGPRAEEPAVTAGAKPIAKLPV